MTVAANTVRTACVTAVVKTVRTVYNYKRSLFRHFKMYLGEVLLLYS